MKEQFTEEEKEKLQAIREASYKKAVVDSNKPRKAPPRPTPTNNRDRIEQPPSNRVDTPDINWLEREKYGNINDQMVCPHCGKAGAIQTKQVSNKKGVSGGKAVAGLLTGGLSLLAVGLSRAENETQVHCRNCNSTWII